MLHSLDDLVNGRFHFLIRIKPPTLIRTQSGCLPETGSGLGGSFAPVGWGVGFFSSGWLRLVAQGLLPFAANGGQARIITSPILNEADWEALQRGAEARIDPVLRDVLSRNLVELEATR